MKLHGQRQAMIHNFFSDHPDLHHCILADAWKDDAGRHWLGTYFLLAYAIAYNAGVSTQFGTEDMRIFAPALGLRQIHERHTSANIADMIKGLGRIRIRIN